MGQDLMFELETINSVVQLMNPLTPAERARTITWLAAYYGVGAADACAAAEAVSAPVAGAEGAADAADASDADAASEGLDGAEDTSLEASDDDDFHTFAEFYDFVAPKTARQKVATAASWLEDDLEYDTWKTYDITKLLKSIDQPLKFVSGTIFQEAKKADPLVAAVETDEEEKRFRGQYRLTEFGRAFIQGKFGE